jgi:rod shape-determining protein MreC
MGGWSSFRKTKLFRAVAVAGMLLLLASWDPKGFFGPFRAVLGSVALPFEEVLSFLGSEAASVGDFLGSIGSLKDENRRLLEENVRLSAENARLADMQKENESLRKELDLLPRGTFELEAADVVGQDSLGLGSWLLIGKGASDGIRKGMPVIVGQGVLVGRIEETMPYSSRVGLLTGPESLVNGTDLQTEAKGIVKGQYGLGLVLDMVLQTDSVRVGDDIVTSGLGGDMPRGLLIGKAQDVRASGDHLFQQAVLAPPVKSAGLRTVFVIKAEK